MKKRIYITTGIILAVTAIIIVYSIATGKSKEEILEAVAQRSDFEIVITVTGELQAERSQQVMAPIELRGRNVHFENLRIQDLIPEGTVVDSGDYVAQLDRAAADNRLKDLMDALETAQSNYLKTKLDTTIQLRTLRDDLINLRYNREEMEITLEQSKFEPPATIRQAQINLDKAQRAYDQAKKNYSLKVQQSVADMFDAEIALSKAQREMNDMKKVIDKFTIYAPSSGMLIYYKEWGGTKRKVGSNISPWDLTVATLPDLSSMISKTYVNEIDISKIKVGQEVRIGVDAFPEKKYTGRVLEVANVGEQLPNTDAKVYEVIIKLDGSDPILRPAMTSSNQIVTAVYKDTLSVPLEAIHVDDSIPYVVKKKGTKQIVVLGESNENQIIIEQGLKTGDAVLLSLPDDVDKMKVEGQELVSVILEKERQKKREEERKKAEAEQEAAQRQFAMPQGMAPEQMQRAMQGSDGQRVMIQSSDTGRIRRFQNLTPEQVQRMRSGGNRKPQQLKADTVKISK